MNKFLDLKEEIRPYLNAISIESLQGLAHIQFENKEIDPSIDYSFINSEHCPSEDIDPLIWQLTISPLLLNKQLTLQF